LAERDRGAEAVPEAANDASRGSAARTRPADRGIADRIRGSGPLGWLLLGLGLAAGVSMIVTEFLTASEIRIGQEMQRCAASLDVPRAEVLGKCSITGHESHAWALAILGVLAIVMTLGAVLGRSRPAAASLAVVGLAAIVIALVIDHPSLDKTRGFEVVATQYAPGSVRSVAGPGYKLELVAGVLAFGVGGLCLLGSRAKPEPREPAADPGAQPHLQPPAEAEWRRQPPPPAPAGPPQQPPAAPPPTGPPL
jgi:hypothetical protein